jgi:hypothetical protein
LEELNTMGTPALSSFASLISPPNLPNFDFPGGGAARTLLSQSPAPQRDVVDLVQSNQAQALTEAYESAVYRSLETRQSLSLQFSTLEAQFGQGGGDNAAARVEAAQLSFDFFQETRYEELALFQQRTDAVGEGLDGGRQASFFASRAEISTRFELSISISGAALDGFASTAEGAADSNALIDRLLDVTEQLLGQTDELLSDFFSLIGGDDGEFSAESVNELFSEFITGIYETLGSDLLSALGASGGGGSGGGGGGGGGGDGAGTSVQATSVQLEFNFEFSASVSTTEATVEQGDPIVLDLDGDGVELTSYQRGAQFDLIGSGRAQQVAFVHGGDAFLALDRNGDGIINSGKELFGEQHGARNGFEELRSFDDNGDGVINRDDAIYEDLRLFRDNGNGITEAGELLSLAEAGVEEIDLNYREVDQRAAGGNRITQIASFLRSDGSRVKVADALLNYTA